MSDKLEFKTAGYSDDERLFVWPSATAECGHINDGIIFSHGDDSCWILSFADLEKIYLAAKESIFRAESAPSQEAKK